MFALYSLQFFLTTSKVYLYICIQRYTMRMYALFARGGKVRPVAE